MSVAEQLRRARASIGLLAEEAARSLGIEPGGLQAWEEGREEPSFDDLCEVADLYHRSVDYFLRDIRPSEAPLRLRLREGRRELSPEGKSIRVEWEELCRRRTELEAIRGYKRRILLPPRKLPTDPTVAAREERRRLGLGTGPVEDLRGVVEQQGVYVFELPLSTSEFSGCSEWHEAYGPCILANSREPQGRRSFTVAHEYYHLLLHTNQVHSCAIEIRLERGDERAASRFAAAFLMTRDGLSTDLAARRQRNALQHPSAYAPLARKWDVSVEALLYALKDFTLLPAEEGNRLLDEWTSTPQRFRSKKGKVRPTPWQRRLRQLGQGYTQAAMGAYDEGQISLSKLAAYLGVDIREAREAAEASR
jgi:Zn-dependent peptidase ImmA (M78 family)/DNA-binding XRE family transcriptional regulator